MEKLEALGLHGHLVAKLTYHMEHVPGLASKAAAFTCPVCQTSGRSAYYRHRVLNKCSGASRKRAGTSVFTDATVHNDRRLWFNRFQSQGHDSTIDADLGNGDDLEVPAVHLMSSDEAHMQPSAEGETAEEQEWSEEAAVDRVIDEFQRLQPNADDTMLEDLLMMLGVISDEEYADSEGWGFQGDGVQDGVADNTPVQSVHDPGMDLLFEYAASTLEQEGMAPSTDAAACVAGHTSFAYEKSAQFYLDRMHEPLYEGAGMSMLQYVYAVLSEKSRSRSTDTSTDRWLRLHSEVVLPAGNLCPPSLYLARCVLGCRLASEVERHVCDKDHWLFPHLDPKDYKAHVDDKCPVCQGPRFKVSRIGTIKAVKTFWYLGLHHSIRELFTQVSVLMT